jgi:hypothetical protein
MMTWPTHLTVVDAVPVTQQPSRSGVLGEGFDELLGGPRGAGMLGDVDVHDAAAFMRNQYEHEEQPARQRREGEEIHRDEGSDDILANDSLTPVSS